mmetsp:Transcript_11615/g.11683  ORF Transcript_11615/g.11683 Transcript_11615/m.11683 type:complete len:267 (-) Transcript_11615:206-1006(-)
MAVTPQTTLSPKASITAISWTGGKDCNLALLHAYRNPDLLVRYLVTFRFESDNNGKSFRAHPIPFMEAQARCLNMQLLFITFPENCPDYFQAYVDEMRKLNEEHGIEVICTGDMDLVGTMDRNWIARCCDEIEGMSAYIPLWQKDTSECLDTMIEEGFEIVFSCVKSPFFDGSWINRRLDASAIEEMKAIVQRGLTNEQIEEGVKPLDLCGERGEYHTMCIDGPLYHQKVEIEINEEAIKEELESNTKWKGNIHNSKAMWTISLKG